MSDTDEAAMRGRPRAHGTKRRSVIVIIVMMMVLLVLLMFLMLFMMVMVASVREVIFIFMLHAPMGSHGSARTCQAGPDKGQQESDNISEKSLASHNQHVNVS